MVTDGFMHGVCKIPRRLDEDTPVGMMTWAYSRPSGRSDSDAVRHGSTDPKEVADMQQKGGVPMGVGTSPSDRRVLFHLGGR